MIELRDKDSGALIGDITEAQLKFMIDQLEEEYSEDTDYYINQPTLDMFESAGADPGLLNTLRKALGKREDMEIRWSRT
jgi:processive 1,2-diacylglycerol beta-glucosyltransferase